MTTHYDGRHRGGVPAETAGRRQHHPAGLVRRPLISLAVATALVGVSAVGYAKAGDLGSSAAASFTIPRVAIAQGADQHAEVAEQQQHRADQRRDDHEVNDDNDSLHLYLPSQTKSAEVRLLIWACGV